MAWHGGSEYAHSSHFRQMDRNERARWRFLTNTARARRRISAVAHDVAQALLQHQADNGRCDPGHARLARLARCSERAVRYALAALKACGLVDWTRRIVRTADGARQTSSAFRLSLAALATIGQGPGGKRIRGTRIDEDPKGAAPRSDIATAADMARRATQSLAQIAQARAIALRVTG